VATVEPDQAAEARRLRADARRNRERILEHAIAAFAEHGYDAQMDDIAVRAGVGVGTVYRHFPTKDALLAELVRASATRCSRSRWPGTRPRRRTPSSTSWRRR